MDMEEKKKYAELMIKVSSELPKMIQTLETGFGIKAINKKTNREVLVSINSIKA